VEMEVADSQSAALADQFGLEFLRRNRGRVPRWLRDQSTARIVALLAERDPLGDLVRFRARSLDDRRHERASAIPDHRFLETVRSRLHAAHPYYSRLRTFVRGDRSRKTGRERATGPTAGRHD